MRIFEHPNIDKWDGCPICGKKDDKPVTLIGIAGTEHDHIMQAKQFHVDCLDLRYTPVIVGQGNYSLIAQAWKSE
ncbi:hypothetical protein FACS189468_9200 [Spirochaetia bacterium]|nr:hypothetical protein FACS189468_9200 [Spirochaetia bacterium]